MSYSLADCIKIQERNKKRHDFKKNQEQYKRSRNQNHFTNEHRALSVKEVLNIDKRRFFRMSKEKKFKVKDLYLNQNLKRWQDV